MIPGQYCKNQKVDHSVVAFCCVVYVRYILYINNYLRHVYIIYGRYIQYGPMPSLPEFQADIQIQVTYFRRIPIPTSTQL